MPSLPSPLRKQLESAVKHARKIATGGARKSLEALAVHEPDPYPHMDETQRKLRVKLRAQARQLGDGESHSRRGSYEIKHLVEKLAYDQWHRILFARYLLENDLLISPEHGVPVSLDDCEELAPSQGLKDAWAVAARFAAVELPEIFRADDPAGEVELPVEDRKPLIALVTGLPVEVFTAGDSLGWCYQFWQADKKDEVNAAGNKIGADELPAVTQLFTEDYMVDFLLDNTLGAWHAGKVLAANPELAETATSEDELRQAVALHGCEWKYLRFSRSVGVSPTGNAERGQDAHAPWLPAAGTFDGWPKSAAELTCLDPCMGSGHFVVAMFERLVALRMAEEKLDEAAAVAAVIRDNLFGLELDPRCTQIAAFNLALAAWRRVGHCKLPAMNLACSGLAPNTSRDEWINLGSLVTEDSPLAREVDLLGPTKGEPMLLDARLAAGMAQLYDLFQKAPVLGSLINPRAGKGDLLVAAFHELQPLLEKALAQETKDDTAHEMAVTARGLAKAAEILAGQFTLVATNPPYLKSGKQCPELRTFTEDYCEDASADAATVFMQRCVEFCCSEGATALVLPQNWLFLNAYRHLRTRWLKSVTWRWVARLGTRSFQTPMYDFNIMLGVFSAESPRIDSDFSAIDADFAGDPDGKGTAIQRGAFSKESQSKQLNNPDCRIVFGDVKDAPLLVTYSKALSGLSAGDSVRFERGFWEVGSMGRDWEFLQGTVSTHKPYGGKTAIVFWEQERGQMFELAESVKHLNHAAQNWLRGKPSWGKRGVAISQMGLLPATLYSGERYDCNCCAIIPDDPSMLPALWAWCSTQDFHDSIRRIDQALKVTPHTLLKVPFDLAHWQKVAAEKYPHGLPKPFSSDPTQWLFNGHPAGADQPLHVAVARLLGYQWPRQTGSSFPDCPALPPDGLEKLGDDDGIVCLSATKGEAPAAERLRALLAQAMGKLDLPALLASAGPGGKKGSKSDSLEDWLRDEFFEQHCALFGHRPFIWHLWDGHKGGFSALVNYHKLTHANLEKLTYAYLGDWIRRQQSAVDAGESGSDARLQAAKLLQSRLKLILEGEPPYDLFVRWKGLSKQAIGWHPDLNDGVRMNIRPFMATDIPGGKKGAGLLRTQPNCKWEKKDRGKEPQRDKAEFPWFWQGSTFTGDRVNDVHLTKEHKEGARK